VQKPHVKTSHTQPLAGLETGLVTHINLKPRAGEINQDGRVALGVKFSTALILFCRQPAPLDWLSEKSNYGSGKNNPAAHSLARLLSINKMHENAREKS
jgi:hypothetical protein